MNNDHHLTADTLCRGKMINDLGDPHPHDRRLAQLREETPQDVARKFADRWPEILIWGAVVAVGLLAGTGRL